MLEKSIKCSATFKEIGVQTGSLCHPTAARSNQSAQQAGIFLLGSTSAGKGGMGQGGWNRANQISEGDGLTFASHDVSYTSSKLEIPLQGFLNLHQVHQIAPLQEAPLHRLGFYPE